MYKILVIGPSWIGDAVMAQSLFKLIKQRLPEALIHVLVPAWAISVLNFMPEVDRSIVWPFAHGELNLSKRYLFAKSLRSEHYDQAIVLPNSFKSALIPLWAKIPLRTGWRGEMRYGLLNDLRTLDKNKLPLMVQRFAALALSKQASLPEKLLWPSLKINDEFISSVSKKYNLHNDQPILALCPGAEYGDAKRWSPEYFAEVAKNKLNSGYQVWLFGGKKDQNIAEVIQQLTNNAGVNLIGKTTLDEAVALLSLVKAVVSNDTGLMHIAAALQRPLVVVYGSTPPQLAPPLFEKAQTLFLNLPCSPCFKRECPLKHDRYRCLLDIKPKMVLDALEQLV